MDKETTPTSNVDCSLTKQRLEDRFRELADQLFPLATRVRETADGLEVEFQPSDEVRQLLNGFVEFEADCCGFMSCRIDDTDGDGYRLVLAGPDGTRAFLVESVERIRAIRAQQTAES